MREERRRRGLIGGIKIGWIPRAGMEVCRVGWTEAGAWKGECVAWG